MTVIPRSPIVGKGAARGAMVLDCFSRILAIPLE